MTRFEAPIALFVYNRPEHTRRTLEALSRNPGASESRLFIFSDGSRQDATEDEDQQVLRVRTLIRERPWCGSVEIIEAPSNRGLATSIRAGVDSVLDSHDRIIVLEDDLDLSPGFLGYMNQALELYESEPRVMNVSSYLPECSYQNLLPETFFLRYMSCWGWATWKEAWQQATWDPETLLKNLEKHTGGTHRFDFDGIYPLSDQLKGNLNGSLDTWAIFWLTSIYLAGGLSLFPGRSLVDNLGIDGSGRHCAENPDYKRNSPLAEHVPVSATPLAESILGRWYLRSFYRYGKDARFLTRARRTLGNLKHRLATSL